MGKVMSLCRQQIESATSSSPGTTTPWTMPIIWLALRPDIIASEKKSLLQLARLISKVLSTSKIPQLSPQYSEGYLVFMSNLPRVPYSRLSTTIVKTGISLKVEFPQSSKYLPSFSSLAIINEEILKLQDGILQGLLLRKDVLMTSLQISTSDIMDQSTRLLKTTWSPNPHSNIYQEYGSMVSPVAERAKLFGMPLEQTPTGNRETNGGTVIRERTRSSSTTSTSLTSLSEDSLSIGETTIPLLPKVRGIPSESDPEESLSPVNTPSTRSGLTRKHAMRLREGSARSKRSKTSPWTSRLT